MDETTCPYCGKPLKLGRIYSTNESSAPYWLPQYAKLKGTCFSSKGLGKAIHDENGCVLGTVYKVGFYQKAYPLTGRCEDCNVLITFMD